MVQLHDVAGPCHKLFLVDQTPCLQAALQACLRDAQVEFILMGGTFMSLPANYRDYFVRGLHDALSGHASSSCAEAVAFAEQSATRCIGLTIETRPDYCQGAHLQQVPASVAFPVATMQAPAASCLLQGCRPPQWVQYVLIRARGTPTLLLAARRQNFLGTDSLWCVLIHACMPFP